ncbi:MAG: sulfatase-like hydrolase/transferase [Dehalococcoidia bacterium]|jgi:uncharacterized sulfatase|nr:sulfatase-like hydrolase/transferase [Dehalococcoidia bacterium]
MLSRLSSALALLLALAGSPAAAQPADQAPPNILFFLSDDQRDDQLGIAGHPVLETPTIDRLASEGVRFTNAFVTTAICMASRASILTGLPERSHHFTLEMPPLERRHTDQSYPVLLRAAGYRTGFVGKFGVEVESGVVREMFDVFDPLDRNPYFQIQADGAIRHITDVAADRAIDFLRRHDGAGGRPFALSVSFNASHAEDIDHDAHYPWPEGVDGLYDDADIAPPALSDPAVFDAQPEFLKASLNRERWFWRWDTPEKYDRNIRAYYRMITGVDRAMGRVLDELTRLGLDDDTVVIFSSDNGYYLGARGFAGKWSHYEESLRVPLVIRDPRRGSSDRGRTTDAMALNMDIPATILDLAGVEPPAAYRGASLRPFITGEPPDGWRTDFFIEHLAEHDSIPKYEGVRGERMVYARYFERAPAYEFLHDLDRDPDQLENLVADPSYGSTLDVLRARTDALRGDYGGPYDRTAFRARPAPERAEQPNIVLIIGDDQSWTDFGFMGHQTIETPNLDALAAAGALFTRGYVPTALCRPSLSTLATGLYAHAHGVTGNDPAVTTTAVGADYWNDPIYRALNQRLIARIDETPTVPRLLGDAGYASFQSGKWWEGSYARGGFTAGMTHGNQDRGGRHGDAGLTIGRSGLAPIFDFIDGARADDRPFFVWYAPFLPHLPHNPPERLLAKYRVPGRPIEIARYFAMCEWFDETVGALLGHLDEQGLADDTLVAFVTDNGWIQATPDAALPDGWNQMFAPRSKQSPFEGGTRTPIVLRWPGVVAPGRHDLPVSSIDLAPTLLAAAGLQPQIGMPGIDLLRVIVGGETPVRDAIFGEAFAHDIADVDDPSASLLYRWAIEGRFKLLVRHEGRLGRYGQVHAGGADGPQLFDIVADPHETTDLAERHPEVVEHLSWRIRHWWPAR